MRIRICIVLFFISLGIAFGQTNTSVDSTRKRIIIENANSQKLDASTDTVYQYLQGNVRLVHDSVFFYCDTAVLSEHLLVAKGNVAIVKGDTLRLFCDSLRYIPDSSKAYFYGYADGNVVLENIDNQLFTNYLVYNLETDVAAYTNRGLLITPDAKVKSGRGFFHVRDRYANFYENVTVEGTDYDILTDSLRFYSDTKFIEFISPVRVTQGERLIYGDSGSYDTQHNKGIFEGNAYISEKGKISRANRLEYDGEQKLTSLLGNATYESEQYKGKATNIFYDENTDQIKLDGNAVFEDEESEVTGDFIWYDRKNEQTKVQGRSFLSKPPYLITADSLDYDKASEDAVAKGNVIWQDTSNATTVYADYIDYVKLSSKIKAFNYVGKPMLESSQGNDTIWMSGDTLLAFKNTLEKDVYVIHEDVEIFTRDMQAICDSLTYMEVDSQFILCNAPFVWSDSSQFSADTIVLKQSGNHLERVDLRLNSLILSTSDEVYFDQISGKNAVAIFQQDTIHSLDVVDDATSVYYLRDKEKAYVGANVTECRRILFMFEDGELITTRFYEENKHVLNPMKGTNHKSIRVKGFNWNVENKPITVEDLKN